jgi:hypothetical protein
METRQAKRDVNGEFPGGKEDWAGAAGQAVICRRFSPDVEEEWVADEERSCYNCRYRRWTAASFVCQAPLSHDSSDI